MNSDLEDFLRPLTYSMLSQPFDAHPDTLDQTIQSKLNRNPDLDIQSTDYDDLTTMNQYNVASLDTCTKPKTGPHNGLRVSASNQVTSQPFEHRPGLSLESTSDILCSAELMLLSVIYPFVELSPGMQLPRGIDEPCRFSQDSQHSLPMVL